MEETKQNIAKQFKTNRSLVKMIFFSIITLGIYPLIIFYNISEDINIIASPYDGKKTMNFLLLFFLIGPITLEIGTLIWYHHICNRIGDELDRRKIDYKLGAGSFWGWALLGSLIIVGPFVFIYKFMKSMNLLCDDYNVNG